jgi:hypothetical protein
MASPTPSAAQIGHRNPGLVLLQNPDDLLFLPRAASLDDVAV